MLIRFTRSSCTVLACTGLASGVCFVVPADVIVLLNATPPDIVGLPFFRRSFFWALLQANSCVLQLRVFCFPGSALTPSGSLP